MSNKQRNGHESVPWWKDRPNDSHATADTSQSDFMGELEGEHVMQGVGVAPGIAIGPVYVHMRDAFDDVERRDISEEDVQSEVKRFERAVTRSESDLNKIISVAREKLGDESADIFEAQKLMVRDEAVYEAVVDRIRQRRSNAEHAVQAVMSKHRRLMEASDSEYLRERTHDLQDVQERIIRHLRRGKIISAIDPKTIVVAENLTAADIILFSRRSILGCATDFGGATSHVSIMARALGVPAVVSMHGITDAVESGDILILDGLTGKAILNPTPESVNAYTERQERYRRLLEEQKQLVPLPAETLDGHHMRLTANVELEEELKLLSEYGADGIGLFRTEFLFFTQRQLSFSEEQQYETYRRVVEAVKPQVTTFRVLDLGGDKILPMAHREHNPMLGWRGIRILLDRPDLLAIQLRAMLRASAHGPIRILLPMVTHLEEVYQFRHVYQRVVDELREEGVDVAEDIPLGVMVEVPAVALMAERFAPEVDFFSIGTNDLTQYVLALDRGNDLVAEKYDELHPAVLALIHHTIEVGHEHGIPVSLCGEMGANPQVTPILVGLGLVELSASPTYLPEIKRVIRSINYEEAQALAKDVLAAASTDEVHQLLEGWLDAHDCNPMHILDLENTHAGQLERFE